MYSSTSFGAFFTALAITKIRIELLIMLARAKVENREYEYKTAR